MKLHKLNTSHLQYVESGEFIIRFLTDFGNSSLTATDDPEFNALFNSLTLQSPVYNRALMQVQARSESDELLRLDGIRDQKISTVRSAVNVYKYTDDEAEKLAYALIMTLIDKYKGIEIMNFEAQSLAIDNFVAHLKEPNYIGAVNTLRFENHVSLLETTNNNFKTLFSSRSTGMINTEVYDTKTIRKNILTTYKDLAEYVYVMAKQKKTPYFMEILNIANTGRSYYSDILARRKAN